MQYIGTLQASVAFSIEVVGGIVHLHLWEAVDLV